MSIRRLILSVFLVAACTETAPSPAPNPRPSPKALPTSQKEEPASTQAASAPQKPAQTYVLLDLMKKIRNLSPGLAGGENSAQVDAQMEEFFQKIVASAPNEGTSNWKSDWERIVNEAKNGARDENGIRPWNDACRQCHNAYRETYRQQYRTRPIPVIP